MDDDLRGQILAWVESLDLGEPVTPDEARARAVVADDPRRPDQRRRRLVAAAVIVLAVGGGLVVRSGASDDAVTAGPPMAASLPRGLDELADRVVDLPTTVLGATAAAHYTYRRAVTTFETTSSDGQSRVEQQWVGRDGSGREVFDVEGKVGGPDEVTRGPGTIRIGELPPHVALGLPDDVDAVMAAMGTHRAAAPEDQGPALIDVLTHAGIPGPARAGVIRALDRIGFVPVPGVRVGPGLMRVEGPGPDGTMQADLDLRTGAAVAWTRPNPYILVEPDGAMGVGVTRFAVIEVGLRRDTRGP